MKRVLFLATTFYAATAAASTWDTLRMEDEARSRAWAASSKAVALEQRLADLEARVARLECRSPWRCEP